MGPLTEKLISEMDELSKLLDSVGEAGWSNAVKKSRSCLLSSNYGGIEDAKTWFGTVGTLNDLVIHPINGHKVDESDLDRVNSRVGALRSSIYSLIQDIERNVNFK